MPAMQERPGKVGSLEMDGPAPQPAQPAGGSLKFTLPPIPHATAYNAAPVVSHWAESGLAPHAPNAPLAIPPINLSTGGPNPLAGKNFYVDPNSNARSQAAAWRGTRPDDAAQMDKIANAPQATWLTGDSKHVDTDVHDKVEAAKAQGTVPVFVAYNIPNRDVGQYSKGGVEDTAAYQAWVDKVAAGIKGDPAVVVLEPDALAQADNLPVAQREERYAMMRNAVTTLKKAGATVYLDAGNPEWKQSTDMAQRLQSAGVAGADGFALNTSNFFSTDANIAYGTAIAHQLGGKHFVVDTSRNGVGPAADREWCNPAGRALGQQPTTATGNPLVDAFLWAKRPGESDGLKNGGRPAGQWMPEYALDLANRAASAGTHPPGAGPTATPSAVPGLAATPAAIPGLGAADPAHSLANRLKLSALPPPR